MPTIVGVLYNKIYGRCFFCHFDQTNKEENHEEVPFSPAGADDAADPVLRCERGAGVFTGVGDSEIGGKGAIEVAVTVDENGAVTAIEVTKNGDTAGISDPAVAQIPGSHRRAADRER